jgi:hypothetical protein
MAWNPSQNVVFTEVEVIAEVPLWDSDRSTGIIQVALGSWDNEDGAGRVGIDVRQWVYTDRNGWRAGKGLFISNAEAVEPTAQAMMDALAQFQKLAEAAVKPQRTQRPTRKAGGTATARKAVGEDKAAPATKAAGSPVRRRTPSPAAPRKKNV